MTSNGVAGAGPASTASGGLAAGGIGGAAGVGGSSAATAGAAANAGAPAGGGGGASGTGGSGGVAPDGGAGSAGGPSTVACVPWAPCDDGDPATSGDVCSGGICAGATADEPFIVHEWGTYTSVKASDGHTLGGVHHIDEALPAWVHARVVASPSGNEVELIPEEPLQQLETPVLYFHSNVPRAIHVDVAFPQGIVGEWYPAATSYSPPIGSLASIAKGTMSWDLTIDATLPTSTFPPVSPDEIWAPSRNVSCLPVRTAGDEREQFVFYRGLGKFDPPVSVSAPDDATIHIENLAAESIPAVFVLRASGQSGAFAALGPLAAGTALDIPLPATVMSADAMTSAARTALQSALEASGLFSDEATAMVDTWTRSWLQGDGLRILYVAPRAWTDGWLPTTITPAPTSTVRTLVGRIEVLTPADEAALVGQITSAAASGCVMDLKTLGRFAEPLLFRAIEKMSTDPMAFACAQSLRLTAHGSVPKP